MRNQRRLSSSQSEGGFTLIELLVVIIIIGILAAIAIPTFLNQRRKGYDAAAKSDLRNMATAEEAYLTDNSVYTSDVNDLVAIGLKKSGDVSGYAAAATADTNYLLTVCSHSGKQWRYDSSVSSLVQYGSCTFVAGG